jgi:hypothetical protein
MTWMAIYMVTWADREDDDLDGTCQIQQGGMVAGRRASSTGGRDGQRRGRGRDMPTRLRSSLFIYALDRRDRWVDTVDLVG